MKKKLCRLASIPSLGFWESGGWEGYSLQSKPVGQELKRVKHRPLWAFTAGLHSAALRLSRHSHPKSETSSRPELCQSNILQEKLLFQ